MHCLRWWLPLFILPLPAASPYLLLLFVLAYAIKTKPCAYCSFIVVGLMISTASWYDPRNLGLSPTPTTTTMTAPHAAPPVTSRASCPAEPDPFHHLLGSITPACAHLPPAAAAAASRSSRLAQQRRKRGNQASYYWLSVSHFVWNFCGHVGTKRSPMLLPTTPSSASSSSSSSRSSRSSPSLAPAKTGSDSQSAEGGGRQQKQMVWHRIPSRIHVGWGELGYGIMLW